MDEHGYPFLVVVTTDSEEHALQVMAERTSFDEEYNDDDGETFEYSIDWIDTELPENEGLLADRDRARAVAVTLEQENARLLQASKALADDLLRMDGTDDSYAIVLAEWPAALALLEAIHEAVTDDDE